MKKHIASIDKPNNLVGRGKDVTCTATARRMTVKVCQGLCCEPVVPMVTMMIQEKKKLN